MAQSLARRISASMHNFDGRHVDNPCMPGQTQADIEILKIEEIARVETTDFLEHASAKKHEAAATNLCFTYLPTIHLVTHFIAPQPPPKHRQKWSRRKSTQKQIQYARVALTQKRPLPKRIVNIRQQQTDVIVVTHKIKGLSQGHTIDNDIRVDDQMKIRLNIANG